MKFVDEYRNSELAKNYVQAIAQITTSPWTIMEICGGQTHSIVKHGIDKLLPSEITLIHGPGCPVCVTTPREIEEMLLLAKSGKTVTSFGDMINVPGSSHSLQSMKTEGYDVRTVYGIEDAVDQQGRRGEIVHPTARRLG